MVIINCNSDFMGRVDSIEMTDGWMQGDSNIRSIHGGSGGIVTEWRYTDLPAEGIMGAWEACAAAAQRGRGEKREERMYSIKPHDRTVSVKEGYTEHTPTRRSYIQYIHDHY